VAKFIIDVLAGVSLIVFWIKWDLNVIIQAICFKFESMFLLHGDGGSVHTHKNDSKVKSIHISFFSLFIFVKLVFFFNLGML
jgi:hypothetical protein